jgi:hypothetical protein
MLQTQFLLFKRKSKDIKKFQSFFLIFSTNLHYNKSLKNLIISSSLISQIFLSLKIKKYFIFKMTLLYVIAGVLFYLKNFFKSNQSSTQFINYHEENHHFIWANRPNKFNEL